jgi:hypothetical protein
VTWKPRTYPTRSRDDETMKKLDTATSVRGCNVQVQICPSGDLAGNDSLCFTYFSHRRHMTHCTSVSNPRCSLSSITHPRIRNVILFNYQLPHSTSFYFTIHNKLRIRHKSRRLKKLVIKAPFLPPTPGESEEKLIWPQRMSSWKKAKERR